MLSKITSPFLEAFAKDKSDALLEHLWPSAKALVLSYLKKHTNCNLLILSVGQRKDLLYQDLSFFLNKESLIEIPSWDTFFDDELLPSKDIVGKRMEGMQKLLHSSNKIVLTPLSCALQKIPAKNEISKRLKTYHKGEKISFDVFIQTLSDLGYTRGSIVSDKGQFSVRGGIVDLFPLSSTLPVRIEFFGDEIEEIRTFDVADQRTVEKVTEFFLCPATEKNLIEKSSETLLDYLGKNTVVVFDEMAPLEDDYFAFKEKLSSLQMNIEDFFKQIASLKKVFFTKEPLEKISSPNTSAKEKYFQKVDFDWANQTIACKRYFHSFVEIEEYQKGEALKDISSLYVGKNPSKDHPDSTYIKGSLSSGLTLLDSPLVIYTDEKNTFVRREILRQTFHTPPDAFHMLEVGDPVVHTHSGIGKFLGIEKQKLADGTTSEFLALEFAENSKLYVPLSQSHLVSRYIGSTDTLPHLSKLGSKKWEKTRLLAQKQIIGYAKELLEMQAERVVRGGHAFPEDSDELKLFEEDFPYTETEDQLKAIQAVKNDLQRQEAMDRLVLGDVGYGKTEVAIRAAFKTAYDGKKQVAILVPTTVLAMQHYENFSSRMKNFPIRVEALYRHQKNTKKIIEELKKGDIDIIIATHRLLSKDIQFKDLGLLIIDEEQRFGVRAKEHLKKAKKGIDTLTLSATPIPRTLYMSIIQIKDMSTISTPPFDRLPIKTIICENEDNVIRNALLREHLREGQSYFIHNRVETIAQRAEHIKQLIPQANVAYVHGQMSGSSIDDIFCAFKEQKIDILVATTLIESGIDVPNANTLLVDNAHRFGLADLYQLRGRVGRWNRPAFAYFLLSQKRSATEEQKMRLSVLAETSGFGGGMKIAMRDLEIRGAGDILGTKQSGQISQIGFHLYCKLLKQTIGALKQNKPFLPPETKIEFSYPAFIPEDYISEPSLRMEMYHKLGESESLKEITKILEEIADRFGKAPEPVLFLYHLMRLKIFCTQNYFTHLKFQKISFLAKQEYQKKKEEKTIMLAKKYQSPEILEKYVIESLKKQFVCPNESNFQ